MAYTKHLTENAILSGGKGDEPIYYIKDSAGNQVWWTVTAEEADTWIENQD
tara:strand:- start:53 stop:205 length:153 start_codon:yes stop_codon:yes gene_type:complete